MNRNRTIWICAAIVLLGGSVSWGVEVFPAVHNEPIAVRVLGAKDGKPRAGVPVELVGGYDRRDLGLKMWREVVITDSAGMARVSNSLRNLPWLRVELLKGHACLPGMDGAAVSIEEIRRDGLSQPNRCGTAVVENAPGVFTVFVKGGKEASRVVLAAVRPVAASSPLLSLASAGAGAGASVVSHSTPSAKVAESSAPEEATAHASETPAPRASAHELESAVPYYLASEQTARSQDEMRAEGADRLPFTPFSQDAPRAGGPAPKSGQRRSNMAVHRTPAKTPQAPVRSDAPGAAAVPKEAGKEKAGGQASTSATGTGSGNAATAQASAKSASAGHREQTATLAKVPAAKTRRALGKTSVAGVGFDSPRFATQGGLDADLPANPAPDAVLDSGVQEERVTAGGLRRYLARPSAARDEVVLAGTQAAKAAASGAPPQRPGALPAGPTPHASPPVPAPVHVRAVAPALKPQPEAAPFDEDADFMCEPG